MVSVDGEIERGIWWPRLRKWKEDFSLKLIKFNSSRKQIKLVSAEYIFSIKILITTAKRKKSELLGKELLRKQPFYQLTPESPSEELNRLTNA